MKDILKFIASHTPSRSLFFTSPSPPGWVRPNLGGQCCIIRRGLPSSAQLCVGCAPLMLRDAVEQTPLHHLSSAPHIQLEAEQASAKNLQPVISLWKKKKKKKVSEKSTGESAWHLTRHISVVGFFCLHIKSAGTIESTHSASHPYSNHSVTVFTHSHDAEVTPMQRLGCVLNCFFYFYFNCIPLTEESLSGHLFFNVVIYQPVISDTPVLTHRILSNDILKLCANSWVIFFPVSVTVQFFSSLILAALFRGRWEE